MSPPMVSVQPPVDDLELRRRIGRLEGLLVEVEAFPDPACRAKAREAIHGVLELHAAALARILERIGDGGPISRGILNELAQDELVGSVLLLHQLHPDDMETRIRRALEGVRPRLGSHGGDVELLGITEAGAARIRLQGNCRGCPSSRETLRMTIEEAIYAAAPDVAGIVVEEDPDQQLEGPPAADRPVFLTCPLPPGGGGD
jgi:Fe-S cluster biogenesis protein NfuA